LCAVCVAKQSGCTAPRRKCSCSSGLTAHRERTSDRAKERTQRSDTWQLPCSDGLQDRIPADLAIDWSSPSHRSSSDWGRFVDRLEKAAQQFSSLFNRDGVPITILISNLRAVLSSSEIVRFRCEHAKSLDQELRDAFGWICSSGPPEAAQLFINAGLNVTDLATFVDEGPVYSDGSFDLGAPCAAQPIFHAAGSGNTDMALWLLGLGANPHTSHYSLLTCHSTRTHKPQFASVRLGVFLDSSCDLFALIM